MKGVILAAGFGTRLWPLTEKRPKPAIPFLGRPLIAYSVEYLVSYGICDIIVNLHHQPDAITSVLGNGSAFGARIHYSFEPEILGTSGALDRVRDLLADTEFVVINGKMVTDIDLSAAIARHHDTRAIATLVLRWNETRDRFSIVEVDEQQAITRFAGFPDSEMSETALMFTGIQVLSPAILEYVPRNQFSHSTTAVYPQAISAGEKVMGYIAEGAWYEMSTARRYLEASLSLATRNEGLNPTYNRSLLAGRGCVIGQDATVRESVLWDDVTVGRAARVTRSVLADGVRIPEHSIIESSVVVRRETITKIERGEVYGDNLIVPLD